MGRGDRWYNRIVRDSRYNDRMRNRTIDPEIPFITSNDLQTFQTDQQNRCLYCYCFMNWLERRSCKQGLTLERRNNRLPHYKNNCKGLVCKSCNSRQMNHEQILLRKYFGKWKSILDVVVKFEANTRSSVFV